MAKKDTKKIVKKASKLLYTDAQKKAVEEHKLPDKELAEKFGHSVFSIRRLRNRLKHPAKK
jgi:hypothetical protein